MIVWSLLPPLDRLRLHAARTEGGLCALSINRETAAFEAELRRAFPKDEWKRDDDDPLLSQARDQLAEYFQANRCEFELPLAPRGTPFQHQVWDALKTIPHGETRTYVQIATQIGSPKSVRAVGAANGKNPIAIVIPCHRVIGADGSLHGYAGGLEVKQQLLKLESSPGRSSDAQLQWRLEAGRG